MGALAAAEVPMALDLAIKAEGLAQGVIMAETWEEVEVTEVVAITGEIMEEVLVLEGQKSDLEIGTVLLGVAVLTILQAGAAAISAEKQRMKV